MVKLMIATDRILSPGFNSIGLRNCAAVNVHGEISKDRGGSI